MLLHDIAKLGVSSLILDTPSALTDEEFHVMRQAHHERLDGHGYDLGLGRGELPMLTRVLCAADVCDALRASRPYRPGMPIERIVDVMRRDVGGGLDATVSRRCKSPSMTRRPAVSTEPTCLR